MFMNPNLKDQKYFYHIPSENWKKNQIANIILKFN